MPGRTLTGSGGVIFVDVREWSSIDSPVESERGMDSGVLREVKEIEMAHLQLRYAHTRIERPQKVLALASAIERFGQILPVVVLREGENSFILIDGYQRVKALKRCLRDTVMAEIWECKEEEALLQLLARSNSRKWDLLEEAALLRELHNQHHLSQSRIASMVGRKQSWVSGRLALYSTLSEGLLESIRKGSISTWAATRVIVPIARAIPEHAQVLSKNLSKEPLSTRELTLLFHHYQKANRKQRENIVHEPLLFLKALHAKEQATEANSLKEGPEGKWLSDLRIISQMLRGLLRVLPTLFSSGLSHLDRPILLRAFEESQKQFIELEKQIRRYEGHDHYSGDQASHFESFSERRPDPADQPNP